MPTTYAREIPQKAGQLRTITTMRDVYPKSETQHIWRARARVECDARKSDAHDWCDLVQRLRAQRAHCAVVKSTGGKVRVGHSAQLTARLKIMVESMRVRARLLCFFLHFPLNPVNFRGSTPSHSVEICVVCLLAGSSAALLFAFLLFLHMRARTKSLAEFFV